MSGLIMREYPTWVAWLAAGICFVSGIVSSYCFKLMDKSQAPTCDGCETAYFVAPFTQSFFMFAGETLALILYGIDSFFSARKDKANLFDFERNPQVYEGRKSPVWYWFLPALLDLTNTTLSNIAMTYTYASTSQMLRNFSVCICAVEQLLIIRRGVRVHEWFGVIIMTVAMMLAAIPAIIWPDTDIAFDPDLAWIGIVMQISATVIEATLVVFEDFLFRKGRIAPSKAVGLEGVSGMVYTGVAMAIAAAVNYEDVKGSLYQVGHHGHLLAIVLCYLPVALIFNVSGLATTKLGGSLLRSIMQALRSPVVWLLDLATRSRQFDWFNLSAVIVFAISFDFTARLWPASWKNWDYFMSRPLGCWCTRPELDEPSRHPSMPPYVHRTRRHQPTAARPEYEEQSGEEV